MRKMTQLVDVPKSTQTTTAFTGYNHQEIINDGEMYDTKNLCSDLYPSLSPRKKRGIVNYDPAGGVIQKLGGIHGRDQLVFVRGKDVYYNFQKVQNIQVSDDPDMIPKRIVSMGAYVCIWPDKVYFNTVDKSDCGSMERKLTLVGESMTATMCRGDGANYDYTKITQSETPPEDPENGAFWLDQSSENDVLRQYVSATMEWAEVPTVYVKIEGNGIGYGLKEYDCVEITGIDAPDGYSAKTTAQAQSLNGSKIIYGVGDNYIMIAGLLNNSLNELRNQDVHVDLNVPDLNFVCESNNRLWGCKYGIENGQVVNEIRASKLGDFRNWSCFMNLATDSYTASIGTDGQWTGAISQRGYPVFFKENAIHRVSGNMPGNFTIQTTIARGVQAGSWRSVCVVNENIYYKSRDGVMMYDGNMPVSVSEKLGNELYSEARAGVLRDKYYISMKDTSDTWSLFVYDTKYGNWFREDGLKALGFGAAEDELYAIDENHNTLIYISGTGGELEEEIEWMAVFGISGMNYQANKYGRMTRADIPGSHYLKRFDLRMYLEEGSEAKLEIEYDSNGVWEDKGIIHGTSMRTFVLPVTPKRCDHLRFRISGKGDMRLYSISRIMEVGSDA